MAESRGLETFESEGYDYDAFIAEIDSIVMRRTTFEQVRSFGKWAYESKPTIVMSSQELKDLPNNARVSRCDTQAVANEFNSGIIWVLGGARTICGVLHEGIIDRIELFGMPVLLGDGLPLFERSFFQASLQLKDTHKYSNGVVKIAYGVS